VGGAQRRGWLPYLVLCSKKVRAKRRISPLPQKNKSPDGGFFFCGGRAREGFEGRTSPQACWWGGV